MGFTFLKHPSLKCLLHITKYNCLKSSSLEMVLFCLLSVSSLPQAWVGTRSSFSRDRLNSLGTSFPRDHIATCITFWYPGPIINHWRQCRPTDRTGRAKILLKCTERHPHTAGLTSPRLALCCLEGCGILSSSHCGANTLPPLGLKTCASS